MLDNKSQRTIPVNSASFVKHTTKRLPLAQSVIKFQNFYLFFHGFGSFSDIPKPSTRLLKQGQGLEFACEIWFMFKIRSVSLPTSLTAPGLYRITEHKPLSHYIQTGSGLIPQACLILNTTTKTIPASRKESCFDLWLLCYTDKDKTRSPKNPPCQLKDRQETQGESNCSIKSNDGTIPHPAFNTNRNNPP